MKLHVRIRPAGGEFFSLSANDKLLIQRLIAQALPNIHFEIAKEPYRQGASPEYLTVIFTMPTALEIAALIDFVNQRAEQCNLCIHDHDFFLDDGDFKMPARNFQDIEFYLKSQL